MAASHVYTLNAQIFNAFGRWSTYGAPTDVKVLSDVTKGQTRILEVAFSVLSQAGSDSPRKGVVAAVQPAGSSDALMLVSSAAASYNMAARHVAPRASRWLPRVLCPRHDGWPSADPCAPD